MSKILKIIGVLLGLFLLLLIGAAIYLFAFFNPNLLKPYIKDKIYQSTGKILIFKSDIEWSFYPSIGLNLGTLSLQNQNEQTPLLKLDDARISVKTLPVFQGKIVADHVFIQGLTINVRRDQNGLLNWNGADHELDKNTVAKEEKAKQKIESKPGKAKLTLADYQFDISSIDIKDAAIHWANQKTNQKMAITDFNLWASNLNQINQTFPLRVTFKLKGQNPNVSGRVVLNSQCLFGSFDDLTFQNANLIADLKGQDVPSGNMKLKINSDIFFLKNKIGVKPLSISFGDSESKGDILITQLDNPKINLRISNTDPAKLLSDFGYNFIEGNGFLKANLLITAGDLRTLNGQVDVNFQEAVLKNIDLSYYLQVAKALIEKEAMPAQKGGNETDVGKLIATLNFRNGTAYNDDLTFSSNLLTGKGKGNINLVNKSINYQFKIHPVGKYAFADIVINLTGPLDHPKQEFDMGRLTRSIAQHYAKELINKQKENLQKEVKSKLNDVLAHKNLNLSNLFG